MQLLAQTTTYPDSAGAAGAIAAAMGTILIFGLIAIAISVAIYYVILGKAGFNPWLSLLVLIPGLGHLIILIILVFTEWPIQRELRALHAQYGGGGGYGGTAYPGGTTYPGATGGTTGTTITPT